jgi:hypothetical protein
MGERFGIQPSAFRSRIFREVKEDGSPLGPALFQGLIQIFRPIKVHLYPFFRVPMLRRIGGPAPAAIPPKEQGRWRNGERNLPGQGVDCEESPLLK